MWSYAYVYKLHACICHCLKHCPFLNQVWNPPVSMRPHTTVSWSATWTSERICTLTPSCLEAPPCTQVSPIVCRRKSLPSHHQPWRSRSSHHQSANTPYGSVAPSWPLCPPSNRCGSANRNTTNPAPASSTGSASKLFRDRVYDWTRECGDDNDDELKYLKVSKGLQHQQPLNLVIFKITLDFGNKIMTRD